ncbi:MAG TPA: biotin/lipoyl-containing protein, partial [Ilumatobacteraceae bacterium]|nr:biotin/lipoyl-containing protein [Ilumatobacteraceae bacterium]
MPEVLTDSTFVPFTMPSLGADMDAGTVVEWLIKPGSVVHRGDIVAIVQTDKSDLDVEVFADGTVVELVVPVGEKVPVGTTLALLAPEGRAAPQPSAPLRPAAAPETGEVTSHAPAQAPVLPPTKPVLIEPHLTSPVLRHLASERHVDIARVRGSGPGGRVTRDDIEHAGERRRATPRARRLARERAVDLTAL